MPILPIKLSAVIAALAMMVLFVAGAMLRFEVVDKTVIHHPVRADARDYLSYALNLKLFGVYSRQPPMTDFSAPVPDALRSPGYPLFLRALIKRDLSPAALFHRIYYAQALVSCLTMLLIAWLAWKRVGKLAAMFVLALVAFSPHVVNMNVYLLSESFFAFVLVTALLVICQWLRSPSAALAGLAGIVLGVAALTRPWIQYLPIFLILFLALVQGSQRNTRHYFVFISAFIVVFAIWLVRNVVSLGATSDPQLVINGLHHGMYPNMMYNNVPESFGFPYRFDPNSGEIAQSIGTIIAEMWRRFVAEPLAVAWWYCVGKPFTLFSWATIQGAAEVFIYPPAESPYLEPGWIQSSAILMRYVHPYVMLAAAVSAVCAWVGQCGRGLSIDSIHCWQSQSLIFFYFVAVHCVTAPFPRYAIPMKPLIYLLAVTGMAVLIKRIVSKFRIIPDDSFANFDP